MDVGDEMEESVQEIRGRMWQKTNYSREVYVRQLDEGWIQSWRYLDRPQPACINTY